MSLSYVLSMFLIFQKFEPQRSYKHGSYKKNKFVRTTMRLFNAIFFSIFFLFYGCYLFSLNCDFTWFGNRFFNLYNLVTDVWIDGWTDWLIEKWTDWQNNGRTGQWMDGHAIYMHRHAKNNDFPIDFVIFTKALRTDGPTGQRTDEPTDGRTYPLIEMR